MNKSVSSRLVLIEPLLSQALEGPVKQPKPRKGIQIVLKCEPKLPLRSLARELGVTGDMRVFEEGDHPQEELDSLRRFVTFEIVESMLPRTFLNLKVTRGLHRPANPREVLAFIEAHPARARRQPIVCLCLGKLIMSSKTGYPAMAVFKSQGEGFSVEIDFDSTDIPSGVMVIMKINKA